MDARGMELRQFGYFAVACQNPNLVAAATELKVAQSTLSAGLQALEGQFGLPLFRHVGKRIYPQSAALWLFRDAVALLHAESFARSYFTSDQQTEWQRVFVDLNLSFTVGRLSKALGRCVEDLHPRHPGVYFDYQFRYGPEDGRKSPGLGPLISDRPCGVVEIDMIDPENPADADMVPLVDDPWVVVSLTGALRADQPLLLPLMSDRLQAGLMRGAHRGGFADRIQPIDDDPSKLARLMVEQPRAAFILPRSMLSNRLGLIDVHVSPLKPAVSNWIGARLRVDHPMARVFVDALRTALGRAECNVVFHPRITLRQMRYFQYLHRNGGISAAARAANVTQPAVTAQLRKLEQTLATPLYSLEAGSLRINPTGTRLRRVIDAVDTRIRDIVALRCLAADNAEVVRIGVIPVADSNSTVAEAIALTVADVRGRFPRHTVQIVEAHARTLHEWIQDGTVGLAVVDTANAQANRIALGLFEPLALVANAALGFHDGATVPFALLRDTPLVLGAASIGLRGILDKTARAAGFRLCPSVEVESLPLALALVRNDHLATVLPPRAARSAVDGGGITISQIVDPVIRQPLNVVFTGRRPLTDFERLLIARLRARLSGGGVSDQNGRTWSADAPGPKELLA